MATGVEGCRTGGDMGFPKFGVPFCGSYNKNYSIFCAYIGVPPFQETTTLCHSYVGAVTENIGTYAGLHWIHDPRARKR